MDLLKQEFDKYVELKNKEIEEMIENKSKNRKMKDNNTEDDTIEGCSEEQPDIEKIDFNTKKTYSRILAEQDKKLKSSKAYKKLHELTI